MISRAELIETAKQLRAQIRQHAGLSGDWEKASENMRDWYLMLARRVEGLETQGSVQ